MIVKDIFQFRTYFPSAVFGIFIYIGNTVVGYSSLNANIAGGWNVALGYNTLLVNTGSSNTAIGTNVLQANVGGQYNTGTGQNSLYLPTY